jgi:glucosamine-6-phosphate deaminase
MQIDISPNKQELGRRAAAAGAAEIRAALAARNQANVVVATGASQFEMLGELVKSPGIDWSKVVFFHLDQYIRMPVTHPASFRKYLMERLVNKLPQPPMAFHFIDEQAELKAECRRMGELIARHPIDVAFIGIGENGHLAFNDPPADFQTEQAFIEVRLDEACRRQQFSEGWFPTLAAVPNTAISMSTRQIMKSQAIVCTVPDLRKATAVRNAVTGPVTPQVPASILQQHERATIFLDRDSTSLLDLQSRATNP